MTRKFRFNFLICVLVSSLLVLTASWAEKADMHKNNREIVHGDHTHKVDPGGHDVITNKHRASEVSPYDLDGTGDVSDGKHDIAKHGADVHDGEHDVAGHGGEHGDTHAGGHHGIGSLKVFFVNFGIFMAICSFLAMKYLPEIWKNRRKLIEDAVLKGERELSHAQEVLRKTQNKLDTLDDAKKEIAHTIQKETELDVADIVSKAELDANRILEQAKNSAIMEKNSTFGALKSEVAESIISKSSVQIKKALAGNAKLGSWKDSLVGVEKFFNN